MKNDVILQFQKEYPNIEVHIDSIIKSDKNIGLLLPNLEELIVNYINENKVDVLCGIFSESIPYLVKGNYVKELGTYIKNSNFAISNIAPAVLNLNNIDNMNSSNIYTISPTFSNAALIYNKEIFNNANIDYPQNNMTWEEVFEICEKLKSTIDASLAPFGFGPENPSNAYYEFKNIIRIHNNYDVYALNSIKLWKWFIDSYKKYSMKIYSFNDFSQGNIAMRIIYNPEYRDFFSNKFLQKTNNGIEFGVVSVPEFKQYPNIGLGKTSDLMLIPYNSNTDNGWRYMEFCIGKKYALHQIRTKNTSFNGGLVSYFDQEIKEAYISEYGLDFTSFYLNKGVVQNKTKLDVNDLNLIDTLCNKYMYEVLRDKITVENALFKVQHEIDKHKE